MTGAIVATCIRVEANKGASWNDAWRGAIQMCARDYTNVELTYCGKRYLVRAEKLFSLVEEQVDEPTRDG